MNSNTLLNDFDITIHILSTTIVIKYHLYNGTHSRAILNKNELILPKIE